MAGSDPAVSPSADKKPDFRACCTHSSTIPHGPSHGTAAAAARAPSRGAPLGRYGRCLPLHLESFSGPHPIFAGNGGRSFGWDPNPKIVLRPEPGIPGLAGVRSCRRALCPEISGRRLSSLLAGPAGLPPVQKQISYDRQLYAGPECQDQGWPLGTARYASRATTMPGRAQPPASPGVDRNVGQVTDSEGVIVPSDRHGAVGRPDPAQTASPQTPRIGAAPPHQPGLGGSGAHGGDRGPAHPEHGLLSPGFPRAIRPARQAKKRFEPCHSRL